MAISGNTHGRVFLRNKPKTKNRPARIDFVPAGFCFIKYLFQQFFGVFVESSHPGFVADVKNMKTFGGFEHSELTRLGRFYHQIAHLLLFYGVRLHRQVVGSFGDFNNGGEGFDSGNGIDMIYESVEFGLNP